MERAKVVLVTGASSGIGRAVAVEMRGRGWRVFATVRRQSDVLDLTKLGRGLIEPLLMDVTDEASVRAAIETIRERAGRLDALVNNAGVAVPGPLELLPTDDLRRQFEVNVFGLHTVTREALPLLRASKGRIVNISSVSGLTVLPFNGPYSASKYAIEALSDALRMELHGVVKVILIEPGAVVTPIWDKAIRADPTNFVGEDYPVEEVERLKRLFWKSGQKGVEVKQVAEAVGKALELPWPLARWVVARQPAFGVHLMRFLPSYITDRLKLKALRWPPRRRKVTGK